MERVLTIIIPFHNGEKSLSSVLSSLQKQKNQELVKEIVFINEASKDNGPEIVQQFISTTGYKTRSITHDSAIGLAKTYNQAILETTTEFFILMHQDVVLEREDSFTKILEPLQKSSDCVASYPELTLPLAVWNNYNFWQKCMFARHAGRRDKSFSGKFDCFNKKLLLEKIGQYDEKTFRTAGEDADLAIRIEKASLKIIPTQVRAIHWHCNDERFSRSAWVRKEAQLSEAYGALVRKNGLPETKFLLLFFRPALVFGLAIPWFRGFALLLTLLYSFLYTKLVFTTQWRDRRVLVLPFFNFYLLFVGTFYAIKGFVTGRQKL